MRLADTRRAEEDDVSLRSKKPSSWRLSICSRLIEGWKLKSKSSRGPIPGSRLERMAA